MATLQDGDTVYFWTLHGNDLTFCTGKIIIVGGRPYTEPHELGTTPADPQTQRIPLDPRNLEAQPDGVDGERRWLHRGHVVIP